MTLIKPGPPLRRQTSATYRNRPLVIELYPGFLTVRPKGKRTPFGIEYGAVYEVAMKLAARAALAERAAKKQRRRA